MYLNNYPSNWDYSVYVESYLDVHFFQKNQHEVTSSKIKQKENDSNIISADECVNILINHTGLNLLRVYESGKVIFLYFPHYKCYFRVTVSNLETIISKIFFDIQLPSEFLMKNYLEDVVKAATYHSRISYLGKYENDIKHNLVSVGDKVLDLNKGVFVKDPSPRLFVANYHDPLK